jgi:hypothetical protein
LKSLAAAAAPSSVSYVATKSSIVLELTCVSFVS